MIYNEYIIIILLGVFKWNSFGNGLLCAWIYLPFLPFWGGSTMRKSRSDYERWFNTWCMGKCDWPCSLAMPQSGFIWTIVTYHIEYLHVCNTLLLYLLRWKPFLTWSTAYLQWRKLLYNSAEAVSNIAVRDEIWWLIWIFKFSSQKKE
jgi:hypothetical protein